MEPRELAEDCARLERIVAQVRLGCTDQVLEIAERVRRDGISLVDLKGQRGTEILNRIIATLGISSPPTHHISFKTLEDVTNAVGVPSLKAMIVAMGMLCEARAYPETRLLGAKCCATAVVSRILARNMRMDQERIWEAEIGGMFLSMGRLAFILYQHQTGEPVEDWFVAQYHHTMSALLMQRYELPDHLRKIVGFGNPLRFGIETFCTSSLIRIAAAAVKRTFAETGTFLVEARMPDEHRVIYPVTPGSEVRDYFEKLGFQEFLNIVPIPHPEREQHLIDQAYRSLKQTAQA